MFYDSFSKLCRERGVSPSAVVVAIGLNKANASFWKKGSVPSSTNLQKLAEYFNVSTDYLLGKTDAPIPEVEGLERIDKYTWGKELREVSELQKNVQKKLSVYVSSGHLEVPPSPDLQVRSMLQETLDEANAVISAYSQFIETFETAKKIAPEAFKDFPDVDESMDRMKSIRDMTVYIRDNELITALNKLNQLGREKAKERIEELTEIPRYRAETTPQSTPAPTEGMDTTPPSDAPETPPEGE